MLSLIKVYDKIELYAIPLLESVRSPPTHGHYFSLNVYGRAPRGPRGVKKSELSCLVDPGAPFDTKVLVFVVNISEWWRGAPYNFFQLIQNKV